MKPLQAVVLRLFSVLALVAGIVMLGLAIPIVQVESAWSQVLGQLPGDWRLLGFLLGGLLLVFGLFGLLPLGFRRGKSVAFAGEHGQIIIQLDPVERKLNKVLNKLPEIRKIRAVVVPDKEGGPAHIRARAWLRRLPDQRARDIELRVADYIEETATDFLGLESRTPVELVIEDIEINIDEAAKELQRHSQERAEEKELSQALATSDATGQAGPTVGQAAATAAAAALAHDAYMAEGGVASTADEAEGYVGVPASLALEDGGIYSPEIPGTATSEYVIGTSAGNIATERADVEDEDAIITGAASDEEPEALLEEDDEPEDAAFVPEEEPEDIEPPEQDAMQIEYTLTTPGEPEDTFVSPPTATLPLGDDPDSTADEGDGRIDSRFEPADSATGELAPSGDPLETYDTPLPPLDEIGPEEDTPYDYGITTESDEEEDLQGLPPLGELQTDEDPGSPEEDNDKWRF
jgi:hypothetical protein